MYKGRLCRSVLYPKCAREGVFDEMALLVLNSTDSTKRKYALSLASRFLLRTDEGAHAYGCATASTQNAAFAERNGYPPSSDKETYYLGFYDCMKNKLRQIESEYYDLKILHRPENEQCAHFNLELDEKEFRNEAVRSTKRQRLEDRNVVIVKMIALLSGPIRYSSPNENHTASLHSVFELPELTAKN